LWTASGQIRSERQLSVVRYHLQASAKQTTWHSRGWYYHYRLFARASDHKCWMDCHL